MHLQVALALGDTPIPIVKVHPTVVFSILNSFVRREKRDSRVIGTLLGVVKDGQIEVIMSVSLCILFELMYVDILRRSHLH